MGENRRRHVRVAGPFDGRRIGLLEVPVQIYDLSEGGCFVNSMQEQREGREVELEIHLPTEGTIRLIGQTLYSRPGFGFATRFLEMSSGDQEKLGRELDRLRKRSGTSDRG